jgi:DNA-binding winged helix-turn-helix (wHTH) protein
MKDSTPHTVSFGPFVLNVPQRQLYDQNVPVKLGSRAMEILVALVAQAGELVAKNDLIDAVWPGATVDESALRVHLSSLRKLLGTQDDGSSYIVNDSGRGYRFNAAIGENRLASPRPGASNPALPISVVRMFGRDDVVSALVDL